MADDSPTRPGFWHTTTGLLTAVGGLIGAVAALITALVAAGAFSPEPTVPGGADSPRGTTTQDVGAAATTPNDEFTVRDSSYSIELQMQFISECLNMPSGPSEQDCQCVMDRAAATYSETEFIDLVNAPETDPTLAIIFEDCFGA